MSKRERAERRRRRITRQVYGGLAVALVVIAWGLSRSVTAEEQTASEPQQVIPAVQLGGVTEVPVGQYVPTEADKVALAKMVWGEARGCDQTQQAATVWCALNRFDSEVAYFVGCETLYDIVTQRGQFVGYSPAHPIDPDIWMLVEDVLARWCAEAFCVGAVGRVLPPEYLFFTGDGKENTFTTEWQNGSVWNWTWDSPYEEE